MDSEIIYKYSENNILENVKKYIDETYGKHYTRGRIHTLEILNDMNIGNDFCIGNIIKYAMRFGKKEGANINDLLKIIHYTIILIHIHNKDK